MDVFETSATVEETGSIRVAGVPFPPGTEVEITVSPKVPADVDSAHADDSILNAARDRMRELFQTVHGFRNSPRIPREDLHERGGFR